VISQRDIALLSFPFSDLKSSKVRPVIVISNDGYNKKSEDMIVVPMTANLKIKEYAFLVTNSDLESGKLIKDSKVKVDRIFSVSQKIIRMKIGKVKEEIMKQVKEELYKLF
jgi:mRNA interferase MazF